MFAYACNLFLWVLRLLVPCRRFRLDWCWPLQWTLGRRWKWVIQRLELFLFFPPFLTLKGQYRILCSSQGVFLLTKHWNDGPLSIVCNTRCVMRVFMEVSIWLTFDLFCALLFLLFKFKVKGNCSHPQEGFYFILKGTEPMTIGLLSLLAF